MTDSKTKSNSLFGKLAESHPYVGAYRQRFPNGEPDTVVFVLHTRDSATWGQRVLIPVYLRTYIDDLDWHEYSRGSGVQILSVDADGNFRILPAIIDQKGLNPLAFMSWADIILRITSLIPYKPDVINVQPVSMPQPAPAPNPLPSSSAANGDLKTQITCRKCAGPVMVACIRAQGALTCAKCRQSSVW